MGAGFTGVISGMSNLYAWSNDEKTGKGAFVDAATDITMGAIDGGAKGVVASGATVLAVHVASKATSTALQTVCRSSAPAVMAIAAVDVAKDTYALVTGEIDGAEFCKKTARTGATAAGGWAGAEVGALAGGAIGGPVGVVIGGVVGGILGVLGVSSWFD